MTEARRTGRDGGRETGGMQARKQKPHSDVGNKNGKAAVGQLSHLYRFGAFPSRPQCKLGNYVSHAATTTVDVMCCIGKTGIETTLKYKSLRPWWRLHSKHRSIKQSTRLYINMYLLTVLNCDFEAANDR